MPNRGRKLVTVKEQQWNEIQKLVKAHPHIVGSTVAEFYRIAAQERLKHFYKMLNYPGTVPDEKRKPPPPDPMRL